MIMFNKPFTWCNFCERIIIQKHCRCLFGKIKSTEVFTDPDHRFKHSLRFIVLHEGFCRSCHHHWFKRSLHLIILHEVHGDCLVTFLTVPWILAWHHPQKLSDTCIRSVDNSRSLWNNWTH